VKERDTNRVYVKVMLPDAEGKRLSGKQLYIIFDWVCKEGTTVVATDDFMSYGILDRKDEEKFVPVTVNHSMGQFSAENGVHTDGIENFWSLVKWQYIGTHRHYSVKYMQNYIDEMCFRQSNRGMETPSTRYLSSA
jgi:hypothetical protein